MKQKLYTCSICTESEYYHANTHFITVCGHYYHYNCLRDWCYINNSCPNCRQKNILSSNELTVCVPETHLYTGYMFYQLWAAESNTNNNNTNNINNTNTNTNNTNNTNQIT